MSNVIEIEMDKLEVGRSPLGNLHDSLTNAPEALVRKTAYAIVDFMQDQEPGAMLCALAVIFVAMCNKGGVRPAEVFAVVERMATDSESIGWKPHFRALRDFVDNEL